jgi:uncharacterized protein YnzC (UPF0291/DUF896 family)
MGKEAGLVMIEKEHIDRINELAAIAKVRELTEEELAERTVLRRAYIDAIKGSLRAHLESIEIVEE